MIDTTLKMINTLTVWVGNSEETSTDIWFISEINNDSARAPL